MITVDLRQVRTGDRYLSHHTHCSLPQGTSYMLHALSLCPKTTSATSATSATRARLFATCCTVLYFLALRKTCALAAASASISLQKFELRCATYSKYCTVQYLVLCSTCYFVCASRRATRVIFTVRRASRHDAKQQNFHFDTSRTLCPDQLVRDIN